MKLNYSKTFLLGFGFFGVSVIWGVYNAFVPVFLDQRFGLAPAVIGFFMTLDNIAALLTPLSPLPVIGASLAAGAPAQLLVIGVLLMVAGIAWAFININSLPMVVDMTSAARVGTYTGLYYLFSTAAAILGPNINGWIVQVSGRNWNNIMLAAPVFLIIALVLMFGVKRGEATTNEAQIARQG